MGQRIGLLVVLAAVLFAGSARGHHNMSALFDFNDRVTLTGTLTQIDWRNPHIGLTVDVNRGESIGPNRVARRSEMKFGRG